jgi:hypothetical protein
MHRANEGGLVRIVRMIDISMSIFSDLKMIEARPIASLPTWLP